MPSAMFPGHSSGMKASPMSGARRTSLPLCPVAPTADASSSSSNFTRAQTSSAASTSHPALLSSASHSLLPRQQAKRLASLFKSHRKQLERSAPSSAVLVEAPPALWDLTSDLGVLRRRLEKLTAQETADSSDSDIDEEDCSATSDSWLPSIRPEDTAPVAPRHYPAVGRVMVCQGRKCQGNAEVLAAVSMLADGSAVEVKAVKCVGRCSSGGCAMRVKVDGQACAVYEGFGVSAVASIMDAHFTTAPEPVVAALLTVEAAAVEAVAAAISGHSEGSCCTECLTH